MGQYWKAVNLSKHECIDPHALGTGLKLWEQIANSPGVGAALIILCAAQREVRGGGDLDMEQNWHGPERTLPKHNATPGPMPEEYPAVAARTIGPWAGDRIALVGDYAERGDLPDEFEAENIYNACREAGDCEEGQPLIPFVDISADVARVIEHELQGKFVGSGWRDWKPLGVPDEDERAGMMPDMVIRVPRE